MSAFVIEDYMLDWHSHQICYPLEIELLLLLSSQSYSFPDVSTARRPSFSRVMRFDVDVTMLHWQQKRNVTLAKRERFKKMLFVFEHLYHYIGIKHGFPCINIC